MVGPNTATAIFSFNPTDGSIFSTRQHLFPELAAEMNGAHR
jgi:hypothetical protein